MSNRENIKKELEEMAPNLSAIPFESPYKMPDGYFASLRCNIIKEIGVKNSYQIPDGYFDQFQAEVLKKVNKPRTKISYMLPVRYVTGIAASLLLMISIGIWYQSDNTENMDFVSEEEYSEYMLSHIEEYDLEEMFDEYDNFELTIDDLNEDEVEYFINNNIALYDLEELSELL